MLDSAAEHGHSMCMKMAEIETLRTFALAHNEIAFAHLCTAALAGEQWAVYRLAPLAAAARDGSFGCHDGTLLTEMRSTDTQRPDGAIARGIEV